MSREYTNDPEGRVSIAGRDIPKTKKKVFHIVLPNTQHYKVMISGKVEQSSECCRAPSLHFCVAANENGHFVSPSTKVVNLTFISCFSFRWYYLKETIEEKRIIKCNNFVYFPM